MVRDPNILAVTVLVHHFPEMAALPSDRENDLIHMPDIAKLVLPTVQLPRKRRTEPATPQSDGLVGHDDAVVGEKVLDISEAERDPTIEPHGLADELGREAMASAMGFRQSTGACHSRPSSICSNAHQSWATLLTIQLAAKETFIWTLFKLTIRRCPARHSIVDRASVVSAKRWRTRRSY